MSSLRAVLLCMVTFNVLVTTAQVPADSVRSLMTFRAGEDTLWVVPLSADHDVTNILSRTLGSFVYDFNTFAWPSGWSIYGLNPQSVQIHFGPIPFDDLLTGRPRYDLLPTTLLRHPKVAAGLPGGLTGVQAELRTINSESPQTELHYQAGDHKLQRVTASHAQQREGLFDQSGHLQGLFAYAGASDEGDYPESRLERQRKLLLGTRFQRYQWSLELLYLHNQRRLGAHSGVLGSDETRYNRLIAQVAGQGRTRRTVRNDFLTSLKTNILTASVYLSSQFLSFADTEATATRVGTSLLKNFVSDRHRVQARIDAYTQQIPISSAYPAAYRTSLIEVQLQDSLLWKSGHLIALGGVRNQSGVWSPKGYIRLEPVLFNVLPFIELSYGAESSPARQWEHFLVNDSTATGRVLRSSAAIKLRIGRLKVTPYGFISRAWDVTDYWEFAVDSIQVIADSYTARGGGVQMSFGADEKRGVYMVFRSGIIQTGRSKYGAELSLPKWTLSGQLGFRAVLFTGDLRLNAFLQGRSWSSMTSRTLHAPTGLLVLPSKDRQPVQASYILDLVVEGKIRDATVYLRYENITSGTELMAGNEIVADYPLPAGQLRFGVYWPITN